MQIFLDVAPPKLSMTVGYKIYIPTAPTLRVGYLANTQARIS